MTFLISGCNLTPLFFHQDVNLGSVLSGTSSSSRAVGIRLGLLPWQQRARSASLSPAWTTGCRVSPEKVHAFLFASVYVAPRLMETLTPVRSRGGGLAKRDLKHLVKSSALRNTHGRVE
uniref:Uncharacterized protein n=1 Tax=Timema poppense TaxID=170557 RepID=A0A7R9HG52_TIMPO|nr:unnamed protein product [Timema poppensis]